MTRINPPTYLRRGALLAPAFLCGSLFLAGPAGAQALPRISALYPPGAKAGTSVDVAIRGGGMEGAKAVLVVGEGITASLNALDVKINPAEKQLFEARCAQCHELRGPGNRSFTAEQWVSTVDRMIRSRGAEIPPAEREKIVSYLGAAARASAGLTARITVDPKAKPGRREIRVVGANGTSTAFPFEVSVVPELTEAEPNDTADKAPVLTLPVTVNGQISAGDSDSFTVEAKKGERVVFNCRAYRLNESSQQFFFPALYLYDEKGKELARNTGYFSLDPLIDWSAPEDGKYRIQIRDMLYRGSPATIYRLTVGNLPYRTYLFPPGGRRGSTVAATVSGENMQPATVSINLPTDSPVGVRQVDTPQGPMKFVVDDLASFTGRPDTPTEVTLPAALNGRLEAADQVDRYAFQIDRSGIGAYTFELFAERIDSPVVGRLVLKDARGRVLASTREGRRVQDPRLDFPLSQPGTYTLEVSDASGKYSPAHVYRVSAAPATPDFSFTVSPDNPNLGPGSSLYLAVRIRNRVGIPGDIEVGFSKLPPGVTASRCVIRPDQSEGFIILTAAADAQPGSYVVTNPVGTATVAGKPVVRTGIPYEIYRINNNAQPTIRQDMVITLGPGSGWRASLQADKTELSPNGGAVTVTVKLDRRGMQADLPFALLGVPAGLQAPRSVLVKRGQTELTFTLTPSPNGVFAANNPSPMTEFYLGLVNGREGEGMMMAAPPLRFTIQPAPPAK